MVLAILNAIIVDIIKNKNITKCNERYKQMIEVIEFFQETFNTTREKMEEIVVEVMRARNSHIELLYWYMQKGNVEDSFSLIQKDVVELTEFIMTIVDNPFSCDILGSKEGTQQKMLSVFHCIERLFNLMEVIEHAIDPSQGEDIESEGKLFREKFRMSVPIFKKEMEEGKSNTTIDCFNKMKVQVAFIVHIGLIMLSYGCNRYSRIIDLLEQLLLLLGSITVSWKEFIKPNLAKYIDKYRKTIIGGKVSNISGTKEAMQCPSEVNKKKGEYFFTLWSRHIIMRKLSYITKHYKDVYKIRPAKAMFRLRIRNNKEDKDYLYENTSCSLFQ
jgi:hypothetical protein